MTRPSTSRQVEKRLREDGVRFTKGRQVVVEALAESGGPRSAAELHGDLGGRVPLSSLYRSLAVLEESGVLSPHYATKGVTRYELAEWLRGHHHHLVCVECGQVEDIEIPEPFEEQVRALVADIGGIVSFAPTNHALEIEGHCVRCA